MNDSDDPEPIDLSTWQPATQTTRKRKTQAPPPPEGETPELEKLRAAAASEMLKGKTVEEIAEMSVRRAANVFLLGGDAMLPTSPGEASNIAKTWAQVAALDKARRTGGATEVDDAMRLARENLKKLKDRAKNGGYDE